MPVQGLCTTFFNYQNGKDKKVQEYTDTRMNKQALTGSLNQYEVLSILAIGIL